MLISWAAETCGMALELIYLAFRQLQRSAPEVVSDLGYTSGFRAVLKRWIVERTLSWLGRQRWLSYDYERLASTADEHARHCG